MPRTPSITWLTKLASGNALLVLLALELLFLLISIPDHAIHIDEGWIGEQAYYLARDGYVHSELFAGFAHNDQQIVVYHRLLVLAGSWSVKLFGWGISSLRMVSIVCGLILLCVLVLISRSMKREGIQNGLLAAAIFLLIPQDFEMIKTYRPEMMAAMFGVFSFWMIDRGVERDDPRATAAAAILAVLAAMSHLYGVVYLIAGLGLLLIVGRWRAPLVFATTATIAMLPYLLDVYNHQALFLEQISNPLVAKKTRFDVVTPLLSLLDEHKRLFRKPEIILATTAYALSLIATMRTRDRRAARLHIYTLLSIVAVGALIQDKIPRYAILLFPFFALAIAGALGMISTRQASGSVESTGRMAVSARLALATSFLFLLSYGLYHQATCAFGHKSNILSVNNQVGRMIPSGATVVAPMNLVFDEIDRYRLRAIFLAKQECGERLTATCLVAFARSHGADYIVGNRDADVEERMPRESEMAGLRDSFRLLARTDDYEVWEVTSGK